MSRARKKYVIVIDDELSAGLAANTAAVLSSTVGRLVDGIIGPDLQDLSGERHVGITTIPIPILKADGERIKHIRAKAARVAEANRLILVDFSDVAQVCKHYDDYREKLAATPPKDLTYLGIALYGDAKEVTRLTGNLGLMR